jgi:hypothetical protein
MGVRLIKLLIPILLLLSKSSFCNDGDYSPQFNELAKKTCASSITRTIHIGKGEYHFLTPIDPFPCALNLIGDGIGSTIFIRDFQGGAFLHWKRGTDHSGGSVKDMTIYAGKGTSGGIAVYIQADKDTSNVINSYNRHTFTISGLLIGREEVAANTSWDHGIYLDGSLNPDNNEGLSPGIRMTQIMNTTVSGTAVSQIYLNKVRGPNLLNVDCFIPLNNSFSGIMVDNVSQGIKIDSRSCAWRFQDTQSSWVVYNGVRFR